MTDQLYPLLVHDCAWVWCTSFNLSLYLICFQKPLSCLHSLDLIWFQKPLSYLHSLNFFSHRYFRGDGRRNTSPEQNCPFFFLVSRIWFWRQWICTHRQSFTKINVGWWYDINACGRRMSGQNNMVALSFSFFFLALLVEAERTEFRKRLVLSVELWPLKHRKQERDCFHLRIVSL